MNIAVPTSKRLKILIADDAPTDRLVLKKFIEVQGHQPLLAEDGLQAIAIYEKENPDIILLDAIMPRMDGFETAQHIRSHYPDRFVPIIFLTSLSEADSLARCLEVGGDDFLTKPYQKVILQAKINAFQRMLDMHTTLQQQHNVIAQHNERLLHEQIVAKQTFDKVANNGLLDAPNLRYRLSPMAVFNGDVLVAGLRPNGNLCLLLGDFTGHGLSAAIGAIPLSQTFYSMVGKGFSIRDILTEINRKLKEILPVGVFCCATIVDMDLRGKQLELWSGGMPAAYLYRHDQQSYEMLPSKHLALGILSEEKFSAQTQMYPMRDGDRLFLWTDGILEAENAAGDMFGEERLQALIERCPSEQIFDQISAAVNEFSNGYKRSDDLSLVDLLMVDAEVLQALNLPISKTYMTKPADWSFSFELRPESLRSSDPMPLLQQVFMGLPGLGPHNGGLFTVLSELYSNALEHGVLGLDSALKSSGQGFAEYYQRRMEGLAKLESGYIRFDIDYYTDQSLSNLCIQVSDSGKGFDFKKLQKNKNSKQYFGRGLQLVHAICHSVDYLGIGNQVRVRFQW